MSIHSLQADFCPGCGQRFNFITFHFPHCRNVKGSAIVRNAQRATGVQGRESNVTMRHTR